MQSPWTVGIMLYADYETLDVMGPVELLGVPPVKNHYNLRFVTHDGKQVQSAQGVITVPNHSFQDCPRLDILLVPGGLLDFTFMHQLDAADDMLSTQHS